MAGAATAGRRRRQRTVCALAVLALAAPATAAARRHLTVASDVIAVPSSETSEPASPAGEAAPSVDTRQRVTAFFDAPSGVWCARLAPDCSCAPLCA